MLDLEAQVDLYFKWENALNDPEPDVALIASLESEAASHDLDLWELNNFLLNAYTAAVRYGATDWNPVLHPRGMDGKFIEVLGRVLLTRFTDKRGRDRDNEIGHVVSIKPAGDWKRSKPNSVDIEVELADGERVLVKPYAVKNAPVPKADVAATVDVWGEDEEVLGWLPEKPSEPKQRKIGGFVNRLATYLMEMDETALDRWFAKFMGTAIPKKNEAFSSAMMTLLASDWNPDLHPRGRDGKFIEVLGLINLFDFEKDGERIPEARGTVKEIKPGNQKGQPDIIVELPDGDTVTVKPNQVESGLDIKARLQAPDPDQLQEYAGRIDPEAEVGRARFQLGIQLGLPSRTEEGEQLRAEISERLNREDGGLSDEQVMNYREALRNAEFGGDLSTRSDSPGEKDMLESYEEEGVPIDVRDRYLRYAEAQGDDRLDLEDWLTQGEPAPDGGDEPVGLTPGEEMLDVAYSTDREIGNLMVGDEVILPGDIPGEVIDFEFPEDSPDSIVVITDNGTYFGKTTDVLPTFREGTDDVEPDVEPEADAEPEGASSFPQWPAGYGNPDVTFGENETPGRILSYDKENDTYKIEWRTSGGASIVSEVAASKVKKLNG